MRILEIRVGKNAIEVDDKGIVDIINYDPSDPTTQLSLYDLNEHIRLFQLCRNLVPMIMSKKITEPIELMEIDYQQPSAYNGFLGFIHEELDAGEVSFCILLNPSGDGISNIGSGFSLHSSVLKPYVYTPIKERLDQLLKKEVKT